MSWSSCLSSLLFRWRLKESRKSKRKFRSKQQWRKNSMTKKAMRLKSRLSMNLSSRCLSYEDLLIQDLCRVRSSRLLTLTCCLLCLNSCLLTSQVRRVTRSRMKWLHVSHLLTFCLCTSCLLTWCRLTWQRLTFLAKSFLWLNFQDQVFFREFLFFYSSDASEFVFVSCFKSDRRLIFVDVDQFDFAFSLKDFLMNHHFHESRNFLILNAHLNQHELFEFIFQVDDKRDFMRKFQRCCFLRRFHDQKYRFLKRVCDKNRDKCALNSWCRLNDDEMIFFLYCWTKIESRNWWSMIYWIFSTIFEWKRKKECWHSSISIFLFFSLEFHNFYVERDDFFRTFRIWNESWKFDKFVFRVLFFRIDDI